MTGTIDDWPGLPAAKRELRIAMAARLKAVTPTERIRRSLTAATTAYALPDWASAELVLAFLSMPSEVDTQPAIKLALEAGKRVAVPRIDDGDLVFVELCGDWHSWPLDRWSIPTPPADLVILPVALIASLPCLVLVPGLAFDRRGGRLGRGKGYYDRFLASVRATADGQSPGSGPRPAFTTVAYGYAFQAIPRVPMGRHDVRLQELALG